MESRMIENLLIENKIEEEILDVVKLKGDASSRKYYRVRTSSKSYILCEDPNTECLDNFLCVQNLLEGNSIKVPSIFGVDKKLGLALQEDLSDETLLENLSKETEKEFFKSAIDQICLFHKIEGDKKAPYSILEFDKKKLLSEVEMTHKYLLKEHLRVNDEEIKDAYFSEFEKIIEEITSKDKCLTHRDYHSRNIMIHKGEQYLIDFQDARQGLPQYDLVSLLEDCYYESENETKEEMKKYYWSKMNSYMKDQESYERFCYLYDLMAIQRIYKAIGSFTYMNYEKGNKSYLQYLDFAVRNLVHFLGKYNSTQTIKSELLKYYGN